MESLKTEDIDIAEIYHQVEQVRSHIWRRNRAGTNITSMLTKVLAELEVMIYPADMRSIYLKKK